MQDEARRRWLVDAEHAVGDCYPSLHADAVGPAHADEVAVALAVCGKVGEQQVIAQAFVEHTDVEHADGAVGVAVDDDGDAPFSTWVVQVEGMLVFAFGDEDGGIAQGSRLTHAVHPGPGDGVVFEEPLIALLCRGAVKISWPHGIVDHREASVGKDEKHGHHDDEHRDDHAFPYVMFLMQRHYFTTFSTARLASRTRFSSSLMTRRS